MGRAFIPKAHRLYYKSTEFHEDFRFTLSFLENCEEILIRSSLCSRAWQMRGKIIRKKTVMRLGTQELDNLIDMLISLVSVSDLESGDTSIEKLKNLKKDSDQDTEGCVLM